MQSSKTGKTYLWIRSLDNSYPWRDGSDHWRGWGYGEANEAGSALQIFPFALSFLFFFFFNFILFLNFT